MRQLNLFHVITVVSWASVFATAPCDHKEAAKCTQPALDYFNRRYIERKTEIITDTKWEADMTKQCELDQTGRRCVGEFATRCFPPKPSNETIKEVPSVPCHEKVSTLIKGCPANSSVWHRACEQPLMEQLHTFLTDRLTVTSDLDFKRLHSRMCCEIGHYTDCVTDRFKDCTDTAKATFQDMFRDLRSSYQCDPSESFKDQKC